MTHRVAIVNLSNWAGENYRVEHDGKETVLLPGEYVNLPYGADVMDVKVTYQQDDAIEPYKADNGVGQILPKMTLTWEDTRAGRERMLTEKQK